MGELSQVGSVAQAILARRTALDIGALRGREDRSVEIAGQFLRAQTPPPVQMRGRPRRGSLGKRGARRITKDGPTGLIVTTTEGFVDREMETRCLSLSTDDTPEQTRRVFDVFADLED